MTHPQDSNFGRAPRGIEHRYPYPEPTDGRSLILLAYLALTLSMMFSMVVLGGTGFRGSDFALLFGTTLFPVWANLMVGFPVVFHYYGVKPWRWRRSSDSIPRRKRDLLAIALWSVCTGLAVGTYFGLTN